VLLFEQFFCFSENILILMSDNLFGGDTDTTASTTQTWAPTSACLCHSLMQYGRHLIVTRGNYTRKQARMQVTPKQ